MAEACMSYLPISWYADTRFGNLDNHSITLDASCASTLMSIDAAILFWKFLMLTLSAVPLMTPAFFSL